MRASGYERVASDWYVEPKSTVEAILEAEAIVPGVLCWDPSCGAGNIPKTLIERGIECVGTDIVDRGYGMVADFFATAGTAEIIITNPPYGVIEPYVKRALCRATDRVIILARLALLEGIKRQVMFKSTPLARVWVSSRRISMPPGGTDIKAKGGAIPYAWFVWEHGHVGRPEIDFL